MVSSAKKSSRSTSPSSPHSATIRLISFSIVVAWPRIWSPRSAWFFSICWRSSGEASKTTPLPKIGVMNGYAAAWSSVESGDLKNCSLTSAPVTMITSLPAIRNRPISPHSAWTRSKSATGSIAHLREVAVTVLVRDRDRDLGNRWLSRERQRRVGPVIAPPKGLRG